MEREAKDFEYYMKLKYRIEILEGEDGYFAKIPDLPGCMTFCDEFTQINEMIEDAKKAWIETSIERGLEIPEPREDGDYSGRLVLRLPKSLHRNLSNQAKREGVSLNQHILSLLSGKSSAMELGSKLVGKIEELGKSQRFSVSIFNTTPENISDKFPDFERRNIIIHQEPANQPFILGDKKLKEYRQ